MGMGAGGIWMGITFNILQRYPGQEYLCMEQGLRRVRGGRARRPRARIVRRDRATLLGLLRPRAHRCRPRRRDGREPRHPFVRHGPSRIASPRVLAVIGRAPVRGAGPRDRGRRPAAASQLAALAIGDRRALRRDVGGRRDRLGTRGTATAATRAGRGAGSHRRRYHRRRCGTQGSGVGAGVGRGRDRHRSREHGIDRGAPRRRAHGADRHGHGRLVSGRHRRLFHRPARWGVRGADRRLPGDRSVPLLATIPLLILANRMRGSGRPSPR